MRSPVGLGVQIWASLGVSGGVKLAVRGLQRPSLMRSRGKAGFTLIELMVSVAIIGVMAMTAAPALSGVLADSRQQAAALDVLRLGQKARSLAMSAGLAHMLRIRASGTGLGLVTLYVGMNSRCNQTDWATAIVAANGHGPIDSADLASYNITTPGVTPLATDMGRFVITLRTSNGAGLADHRICYQPNGESYFIDWTVGTTAPMARQTATLALRIRRTLNGTLDEHVHGVDRLLRFPAGGTPWAN